MEFKYFTFLLYFISINAFAELHACRNQDYLAYHNQILEVEKLISNEEFPKALNTYDRVFKAYDFVFLREYKIAAQLAFYLDERQRAFQYIKEGIATGWKLRELKKNKFLAPLQEDPEWKVIEEASDSLHNKYLSRIDQSIREKVRLMFKKDQRKAIGALFRISDKAKERYAIRKFAPHSETQIKELSIILENEGYPGEQLIGNNFWMSTIISHHNSIAKDYVKSDTLYHFIRPKLIQAIEKGQMSPYEFALIDDWYKATSSGRTETGYGFLNAPYQSTLSLTNELRFAIGLRSVELRNKLIEIENRTGMNLYLPDWVKGKILINDK